MRPIQPSPPTASSTAIPPSFSPSSPSNRNHSLRHPNLTLPLSQRDPKLAVPLPLLLLPFPSPFSLSPPLNFYQLEQINRIGSGSGGIVYKVLHQPTGKFYALKVIYGHHDDSVHPQIYREIQILRDIDNPNVVRCHDMNDHNGEIQVLLEYMDKGSLEGIHIPGHGEETLAKRVKTRNCEE